MEICYVKINVGYRIRKLRESKDYSQENMAGELSISTSAYSKIERGITDPSIGRLDQIAKILGVQVTQFLQEGAGENKMQDKEKIYGSGYATKEEIEEITNAIKQLKLEMAAMKKEITTKAGSKGKKKK